MITIAIIHAATNPARDLCHPQCGQFQALSLISFRHSGQVESATGQGGQMEVFCQGNPRAAQTCGALAVAPRVVEPFRASRMLPVVEKEGREDEFQMLCIMRNK
jgi:hypothetical protein